VRAEPRQRLRGGRGHAWKPEDGADGSTDRVAVEEVGARVGREEHVDAGCAGRSRDRTEVAGPLDRDRDGDERLGRWIERLEGGGGPPDHGEDPIRPALRQARERGGSQLDDVHAGALGSGDEIGVATACK